MALSKTLSEEQKDQTLDWLESNVLNHPEYGKEVKRLLRKVDKRVTFPEIDAEEAVEAKTKEQTEKIDKFLESQKEKENKAWIDGERRKAKESGLITEESQGEFEKWMVDNHMGNYQYAARIYKEDVLKPAEPTNYQERTGIQLPNNKGLFENPTGWAREEAYRAINEMNRNKGER